MAQGPSPRSTVDLRTGSYQREIGPSAHDVDRLRPARAPGTWNPDVTVEQAPSAERSVVDREVESLPELVVPGDSQLQALRDGETQPVAQRQRTAV